MANGNKMSRSLSLALALCLMLTLLPSVPALAAQYGCTVTGSSVKFRQKPSSSATYWEKLPDGWVMEVLDTVEQNGATWYYVQGSVPSSATKTYKGYILGDFFRLLTDTEAAQWQSNPTQGTISGGSSSGTSTDTSASTDTSTGGSTSSGTVSSGSYVKTTTGGVNLRSQPNTTSSSVTSLAEGTELAVVSYSQGWYYVSYGSKYGYVSEGFVTAVSGSTSGGSSTGTGTDTSSSLNAVSATVRTTGGTLTLRSSQSTSASALAYIPNLTILLVYNAGEKWSQVTYNGKTGYVLTSYLDFGSGSGGTSGTATVRTTGGTLTLRSSQSTSASALAYIPNLTILLVYNAGEKWSQVTYNGKTGYVLTSYLDFGSGSGGTSGTATVRTTGGTLTLRSSQSTSASALAYIPHLTVITVLDRGEKWSSVTYNGKTGYVLSSYLDFGDSGTETPTPTPTTSATSAVVKTTGGTLTLRESQSTGAKALAYIPNKTVLTILHKDTQWCLTTYNGKTGYVLTSYLTFDSSSSSYAAYVYVEKNSVYIRASAQKNGNVLTKVNKNVFPMWGSAVQNDGYTWYPVTVNSVNGYVRGDCSYQMTQAQYDTYKNSGKIVTPDPNADKKSSYIMNTESNALNIRAAASTASTSLGVAKKGDVFKYTGTSTVAGVLWYKIDYDGISSFVMGKYCTVLTNAEYQAYISTLPTPTPTPAPTAIPVLADMSDTAYGVKANIFIRQSASTSSTSVTKIYTDHAYMTVLGDYQWNGSDIWYKIKYNNKTGWIRGDLIHIMTVAEKKAELGGSDSSTDSGTYVKYETLRLGSTGDAVTKLQKALVEKGYLASSEVSGQYLSSTKTAVIAFQKANNLTQDGLAGQKTLSKLYGTPTYDTSGIDTTLYPVEMVDWYKGDIQKVWSKGTTAVITDVKTGLSFRARRWSGAYHADVEPLTAADTAVMCKIYGVSDSQDIAEKNLYQRRALWVTVGGRTFAASMYGVPHNYPDGDTIADNDFSGQFCVHFVNSMTHGTMKVDADHQKMIQYAYDHAPSTK